MQFVLCQGSDQPRVATRDATGLALTFHPTIQVWAPAIYKYTAGPWTMKEWHGTKAWTVVLLADAAVVNSGALADPLVKFLPGGLTLNTVLAGASLITAQTWLDATDFGVTITSGMTVRETLRAIRVALNHSAAADAAFA